MLSSVSFDKGLMLTVRVKSSNPREAFGRSSRFLCEMLQSANSLCVTEVVKELMVRLIVAYLSLFSEKCLARGAMGIPGELTRLCLLKDENRGENFLSNLNPSILLPPPLVARTFFSVS